MTKKFAIGTDIGGSHISCALINLEQESILKESYTTLKVDNQAPAEEILSTWAEVLSNCLTGIDKKQVAGIGFAMPGPFDYEKGIALFTHEVLKYEKLYGIDVGSRLKGMLGLNDPCHFRFMNDATSFAVGEAWMGKARGHERSVCITLGTGFGSAFIDQGIPVVEREDVPKNGCVWHLPFNKGIADDSFSTRWFTGRYAQKTGKQLAGVKEITGQINRDYKAKEVFNEFGANLGEFLGPWLKTFDAGVLVIGGNVSSAYQHFGKSLEYSLRNQEIHIEICISELKEDAAIIGSARLLDDEFWKKIKPLLTKM
jgi:glucokinase